ncbi:MAG: hypothetical protein IPH76_04440 [Xanthomonadales bacterium]|nr:hypothetical protein [Xanthomonadales bacterium]
MRLLAITGQQQIGRLRFTQSGEPPAAERPARRLDTLLRETATHLWLFEFLTPRPTSMPGSRALQPKVMMPDADQFPADSGSRVTLVHSDLIVSPLALRLPGADAE